jgi:hypothetical protein
MPTIARQFDGRSSERRPEQILLDHSISATDGNALPACLRQRAVQPSLARGVPIACRAMRGE